MDFENTIKNGVKLFSSNDYNIYTADTLARTRANNLIACNALSTFFESNGEVLTRSMRGYGLPENIDIPTETNDYYAALNFFKKNAKFFKESKSMIKLMNLFSWKSTDDYKTVVIDSYFDKKTTISAMKDIADVDLRKVAKMFAENGDYKKGNLIQEGKKRDAIDNEIAEMFRDWKTDIVKFYHDNSKEEDEKQ